MHFRLAIDPPQAGAWNMALDEALLEAAAADAQCWWRFYRWSAATLSLGYFQDYNDRTRHAPSRDCTAVRRLTGGGAILHDRELTYSFAIPIGHRWAAAHDCLYEVVHRSLVAVLADWSISAALVRDSRTAEPARTTGSASAFIGEAPMSEPFLCFERRAASDVVVGNVKILGSAQRRRRGAVLQHGSILLQRSEAAPELPGLTEAAGVAIAPEQLIEAWLPKLTHALGMTGEPTAISDQHRAAAAALVQTRYASRPWTERRQM